MGVQERRARQKEGLRNEILEAASQLFSEQGYEAVSMRKIAERIEYSPTTIYLHFRDKSDLFDNLCADTFSQLIDVLAVNEQTHTDPLENLKHGLRAYIQFGVEHPAQYRVTFLMPYTVKASDGGPCRADAVGDEAFGSLVRGVTRCMEAGLFRREDPQLVSESLWSAIHGLTALLITHPEFPWSNRDRNIDHLIATLTEGLTTR